MWSSPTLGGTGDDGDRKLESKDAAGRAAVGQSQLSAVGAGDAARDVEPEAHAGRVGAEAGELGEQPWPLLVSDAGAVVGDGELDGAVQWGDRDVDGCAGWAELDRVGDEVCEDLADS